jgi:hypothetical protein
MFFSCFFLCVQNSQLKLVNGVEHDVAVEGFGATELAGAGTYVAAFGSLLAEQVNGF